jgi:GH15 family glucan-1,4-alpha-glucosidase
MRPYMSFHRLGPKDRLGGAGNAEGRATPQIRGALSGAMNRETSGLRLPVPTSLYDYGAIGNLHSVALVSRHGSIDWLCWPRFASPSLLARILDPEIGGHVAVRPREESASHQRYIPSTNLLETRFDLSDGRTLTVTDFMPVEAGVSEPTLPMLLRGLEAGGGEVTVEVELRPRFNYGAESPEWTGRGDRWIGRSPSGSVWVRAPAPLADGPEGLHGRWTLAPGVRQYLQLGWGPDAPDLGDLTRLERRTAEFWRDWVDAGRSRRTHPSDPEHPLIERSELVLKLLSHATSGAFVAAPTTSLPEWPGGSRNWDYRYVWIRDAAFAAQTLLALGHIEEAHAYLRWVTARLRESGPRPLRVLYAVQGNPDLTERTLPHLRGFLDSRPVRVGNGAATQFQLDIFGELLDAAALLVRVDPQSRSEVWPELAPVAEIIERRWADPDRSLWEIRGPPDHYVHSKVMAWVGLDRASTLCRLSDDEPGAARWRRSADEIRREVLARGVDPDHGTFRQAYGSPRIDAANLRIPMVGFLPFDDPRIRATIHRVERELSHGPFVYRYRGGDHLEGPEGAFLPCGFWLVHCLARIGERDRARGRLRGLSEATGPLGLLPEEFDPERRIPLGNFPQAFTHVAYLRALEALAEGAPPADR